jgi:SAM-dependent methyltransferase
MLPFSQAAENNKEPIVRILVDAFRDVRHVLEIGSGTGQHAVHFGRALPHLIWQPSDLSENLDGLRARLERESPANVRPPVALDVGLLPWPVDSVDGIFSANAVHIMAWPRVEDLLFGVGDVLEPGGTLCLYGPFKYKGDFTTPSNAEFDVWLKRQDPESGIRDFEAIDALAAAQGLRFVADHAMPANNQILVWQREAAA